MASLYEFTGMSSSLCYKKFFIEIRLLCRPHARTFRFLTLSSKFGLPCLSEDNATFTPNIIWIPNVYFQANFDYLKTLLWEIFFGESFSFFDALYFLFIILEAPFNELSQNWYRIDGFIPYKFRTRRTLLFQAWLTSENRRYYCRQNWQKLCPHEAA